MYLECPAFERQMDRRWRDAVPQGFTRLTPEELTPELVRRASLYLYRPNPRLFPLFWGPLVARCALSHLAGAPWPERPTVWLPGEEHGLLGRELALAFGARDWKVRWIPPRADAEADLPWRLTQDRPRLYFSVNFRGLDPYGRTYFHLREAGCAVAAWFVDNSFHVLSAVKSRYWMGMHLFVTDDSFVEPLRALGAEHVHHLPLAASPVLFVRPQAEPAAHAGGVEDRLVFVGRSSFPGKRTFFAGLRLDPAAWAEAEALLARGGRPDFFWWARRLGVETFWPGGEVRRAGQGAEESGLWWRTHCLLAAGDALTVFGDEAWRALLPGRDVRGPLDYYAHLAPVYARAGGNLNLTSPLLPHGLTQRHFDVWCAGGVLLTDATPGLVLFPEELTREVTFRTPEELRERFETLRGSRAARARLTDGWRALILAEHTYARRVATVLDAVGPTA